MTEAGLECFCAEHYTKSQLEKHFLQIKKKADALKQELEEEAKCLEKVRMQQKERNESEVDFISSDDNDDKDLNKARAEVQAPLQEDEEQHNVPPLPHARQLPDNDQIRVFEDLIRDQFPRIQRPDFLDVEANERIFFEDNDLIQGLLQ